ILATVTKLKRVLLHGRYCDLFLLNAVEKMLQSLFGLHPHVMVGARHNELIGLEVFVKDHLPSLGAFHPKIVRDVTLRRRQQPADLRADNVVDPVHSCWLLVGRRKLCLPPRRAGTMPSSLGGSHNLAPTGGLR